MQRCWRRSTKRLLWDISVAGGSQVQKCVEVDIKCITAVSVSPAPQWLVAHCEGHGWRGARRDIASAADWRAEFVTRPLMSQLYYMLTSPHADKRPDADFHGLWFTAAQGSRQGAGRLVPCEEPSLKPKFQEPASRGSDFIWKAEAGIRVGGFKERRGHYQLALRAETLNLLKGKSQGKERS